MLDSMLGATLDSMLAVAARLGRPRTATLERLDHGEGGNVVMAIVVEVEGVDEAVVVKRFASPRTHAQACAASRWFEGRGSFAEAIVPRIRLIDTPSSTLVMERLPGEPVEPDDPAVHRAAGRFLAGLHQLEIADTDPLPLGEALLRRHHGWMQACAGVLSSTEREVALELAPRPELFVGVRRVPCHRDFSPDNWLWQEGRLQVVDFEHARLDLDMTDLAKLATGPWSSKPALATAFFDSYGRLPDADCTRLRCAVVLHGLASLAWGSRHAAMAFIDEGHRALALAEHWPGQTWDSTTVSHASPL